MYYYFLLPLFLLASSLLSAATYEVNLEEYFPQQTLFKTFLIEGESLQVNVSEDQVDSYEATLAGPEVQFSIISGSGEKWTASLASFELHVANQIQQGRRELLLDFQATPLAQLPGKLPNAMRSFAGSLIKALITSGKEAFHLTIEASSDIDDYVNSTIMVNLSKKSQGLKLFLDEKPNGTGASWDMKTNLFGKGTLIDILVMALKEVNEGAKSMTPQNDYEELLQNICAQIEVFMDLASPLLEWDGVALNIVGDFDYQNNPDLYSLLLSNDFKVGLYDGGWNSSLGFKSQYSSGASLPYEWGHTMIIKNPKEDVEKLCQWVQVNAIDQLADFLNMPSISYYGSYFPTYFNQALSTLVANLGEAQPEGTLHFSVKGGQNGITIGSININEIGQQLINAIKQKAGSIWG